ncbi:hypothetical protein V6R21_28035 [Limibacter armeniacum]|uniref:hypothetical protein n=1 Tax=Limibacter armeniacum TaxID=466084 RepID=UPI002FE6B211
MKYEYTIAHNSDSYHYSMSDQYFGYPTGYTFDYSYNYRWLNLEDNTLDTCEFNDEESMTLTSRKLKISQKYSTKIIDINHLQKLSVKFRRLMLPLTTGGIIAPLAIAAIVTEVLAPVTGFSIFVIALLMFYYGYRGTYQLNVEMRGNTLSLFIDEYGQDLQKFIEVANHHIIKAKRF